MILVPTFVAPSQIEGVGVFAAEFIASGTMIWRLDTRFDRIIHRDELRELDQVQYSFARRYGYSYPKDRNYWVIEFDNGRFMNHSAKPNTCFSDPHQGQAVRDIFEGEELVCNYGEFEPEFEMLPGRLFATNMLLNSTTAHA
jgi:uncharacterized protein